MYSTSIIVRESDKKRFKVTFLSHWSDIEAVDGSGETDSVKWYGGDKRGELYVSANKGHSYVWKKEAEYVDFDEESGCWGVFDLESGFCYSLFSSEKEAYENLPRA